MPFSKLAVGYIIALVFLSTLGHAQHISTSNFKELKVGDKMPDILLGNIINNPTGKKKFSDFKGKLVILDFWGVYCGSCVADFPHLEKLQKEFGSKIQIIMVNSDPKITPEMINGQFENGYRRKDLHMPDLPGIFGSKMLLKLFKHTYEPHHIWIDGNGIVRVIGSNWNTNSKKIQDFLDGKKITFIGDANDCIYTSSKPMVNQVSQEMKNKVRFNSFFSRFNVQMGYDTGSHYDSASGTITKNFCNDNVLNLYMTVFDKMLLKDSISFINTGQYSRYILDVKDSSDYNFIFIPKNMEFTDENATKSLLCYEQITPSEISEDERLKYMLEDLNRYFGSLYGTCARIERRKVLCYILIKTGEDSLIRTKGGDNHSESITIQKRKYDSWKNESLRDIISTNMTTKVSGTNIICIDESGFKDNVDMTLPDYKSGTFEEFKEALRKYGLDIIQAEREINMACITDKKTEFTNYTKNH